jgi:heme O synthase-like polyprenyltransferase
MTLYILPWLILLALVALVVLVCVAKWLNGPEKRIQSKLSVIELMSFLLTVGSVYFARAMRRRFEAMMPRPSHRSIPSSP